jgi:hypothetical protein
MAMNDTEIIASLKKIVDSVGVGAFSNHTRANALVSDYFPGNDNAKTRKLIKSIIDVDAFAKISAASNSDLDGVCKAVKTLLVDDESLSEDRAEMAIGWVCGALDKRKPNFPKPIQPRPQPIQTTSSGSSSSYSGQSFNSSYVPSHQPTQQSRTINSPSNNTYGLNLNHHIKRKKRVNKRRIIGFLCASLIIAVIIGLILLAGLPNETLFTICAVAGVVIGVIIGIVIAANGGGCGGFILGTGIAYLVSAIVLVLIVSGLQFVTGNTPTLIGHLAGESDEDMYVSGIIQTYSGSYSAGRTTGLGTINITSCDKNGKITGTFSFKVDDIYGEYKSKDYRKLFFELHFHS